MRLDSLFALPAWVAILLRPFAGARVGTSVPCATILLVCLCAAHSVLPDPSCVLLLFAAALRQHHGQL